MTNKFFFLPLAINRGDGEKHSLADAHADDDDQMVPEADDDVGVHGCLWEAPSDATEREDAHRTVAIWGAGDRVAAVRLARDDDAVHVRDDGARPGLIHGGRRVVAHAALDIAVCSAFSATVGNTLDMFLDCVQDVADSKGIEAALDDHGGAEHAEEDGKIEILADGVVAGGDRQDDADGQAHGREDDEDQKVDGEDGVYGTPTARQTVWGCTHLHDPEGDGHQMMNQSEEQPNGQSEAQVHRDE